MRIARFALLVACVLSLAGIARAEAGIGYRGWGPRAGFSLDPDQFFFGAHVDMGEFVSDLHFQPNVTIGFGDNTTLLSLNPDVAYWIPVGDSGDFYAGGLLAFQYIKFDVPAAAKPYVDESDTNLGIHAFAGYVLKDSPFLFELNVGLDEAPDAKIAVGYIFR